MTSGTKIFLAIFALLIGVLVLYYGVWQKAQPLGPASATAAGPPLSPADATPAPGKPSPRKNSEVTGSLRNQLMQGSTTPNAGLLTNALSSNAGTQSLSNPPRADASLDTFAGSGTNTPASAPAANMPLAIDTGPVAATDAPSGPTPIPTAASATSPRTAGQPQPASSQPPAMVEYTIKSGDTGVSIAKEWFGDGNKWTLISKANPWVDFNRLKIGDKLKLPPKDATEASIRGASATEAKTTSKPVTMGEKTTYVVQPGDTLIKIARKHFGSDAKWEAIYDANKSMIGSDPADLKVGMKLTLPAKK